MNEANNIKQKIWKELAAADHEGFFITAEVATEDIFYPQTLATFILNKLHAIHKEGISGRRFVFKEGNWKIYLTFFPRNEVVNERYALKNRAFKTSLKNAIEEQKK